MKVLPNNFHVYVSVLIGHFGLGISNFCVAWSSPILAKLGSLEDNPLGRVITSLESGVLAALPTTGALFGSYCFGYGSRTWGRRPTMIAIGFPTLLAYPMLAYSTNIWEIYIARILCGISLGGAVLTDTIYFAEISGAKDRAFLGTAMTIFINVAGLLVLIIGTTTSYFVFHVILFVFSPIYLILAFFFLSESPFYLIQKDSRKAEACLKVLRGINSVEKELYDIQYSLENNTEVHLGDIFSKRALRKGLIIGLGLVIFQQLTGGSVISTYCQELFQGVEGGIPSEVVPVIYTIVTFVVSFLAPVFISRFGVKNMLVISTIGMSIALFIFGSYFVAKNTGISVSSYLGFLSSVC
ncbi:hypothetical protein HHI36_010694 [Cryptolaemus montrouzieri]|uniref:Major facilitator superfamily (MFS) profile domain-containing protein n=1 Tax=Cryptolaemus montrouzieri TaxID=559131 RepID=A0ABD2MJF1_9CUCU